MGRILVVVLGFGAVFAAAYFYLQRHANSSVDEKSAPKQTLDNVRGAAKRIEDDAQKRSDELLQKTAP